MREWLITNGIGGYAASTDIGGMNIRRYHGLLIAPLNPPSQRKLILSKVDESIEIHGVNYNLFTNSTSNMVTEGYTFLKEFEKEIIPIYKFNVLNTKIEGDLIRHDPDIIASTIIQLICDELVFDDMENDSQFITLNNKLKETEKERKKREKEELKFRASGKSIFERSTLMSKFKTKYQERMATIRKDENDIKENNQENNNE